MKPKWKPHDDPNCTCNGCRELWIWLEFVDGEWLMRHGDKQPDVTKRVGCLAGWHGLPPEFTDDDVKRLGEALGWKVGGA